MGVVQNTAVLIFSIIVPLILNVRSDFCPNGVDPLMDSQKNLFSCMTKDCPENYDCTPTMAGNLAFCCPKSSRNNGNGRKPTSNNGQGDDDEFSDICPIGSSVNKINNAPEMCSTLLGIGCSNGYTCIFVILDGEGQEFCCSAIQTPSLPPANFPICASTARRAVAQCRFYRDCAADEECLSGGCCPKQSSISVPTVICPGGQKPYEALGVLQPCKRDVDCPSAFRCLPLSTNDNGSKNFCCKSSATSSCERGYVNVDGRCRRLVCTVLDE